MSTDSPEPGVMIDTPWMIWCAKHLEPYRKRWPLGYMPASMCLVHQALQDDEIVAATGGKVERINSVLQEYGPLCCRLPEAIVQELATSFLGDDKELWTATLRKYGPPPTNPPQVS